MAKSRKLAIVFAALFATTVGGVAVAYWTAGGSGTGTAGTSTGTALVVNQTSTVSGLEPGGTAQALSGDFDNPNPGSAYVGTVTVSIASVVKAGGAPAGTCDATDYTLTGAAMTVNAQVPAGNGKGAWSGATIAFNNKAAVNQDACKGATVNLAYAIS